MGQHKYNPNCQLAREGKLPERPAKKSKRQLERELFSTCYDFLIGTSGLGRALAAGGVDMRQHKKEMVETYEVFKRW